MVLQCACFERFPCQVMSIHMEATTPPTCQWSFLILAREYFALKESIRRTGSGVEMGTSFTKSSSPKNPRRRLQPVLHSLPGLLRPLIILSPWKNVAGAGKGPKDQGDPHVDRFYPDFASKQPSKMRFSHQKGKLSPPFFQGVMVLLTPRHSAKDDPPVVLP